MYTCIAPPHTHANKILGKSHYFQKSIYCLNRVPCFSFFFNIKQPTWEKQQQKNQQVKPPHLRWHCRVISKATPPIRATWSTKSLLQGFLWGNVDANDSSGDPLHMGGKFWLQRMTFTSRKNRKECKAQEHTKWHRASSGHQFCHWSELASTDFPVITPVISVPLTGHQPSVHVGGCVLNIAKASGRHCYHENTNGFLNLGILVPLLV